MRPSLLAREHKRSFRIWETDFIFPHQFAVFWVIQQLPEQTIALSLDEFVQCHIPDVHLAAEVTQGTGASDVSPTYVVHRQDSVQGMFGHQHVRARTADALTRTEGEPSVDNLGKQLDYTAWWKQNLLPQTYTQDFFFTQKKCEQILGFSLAEKHFTRRQRLNWNRPRTKWACLFSRLRWISSQPLAMGKEPMEFQIW